MLASSDNLNKRPLLEVRNLRVSFPIRSGWLGRVVGQVKAVEDVSLSIEAGETFGLVGESGSGKTTLGRAIAGLIPPSGGSVEFRGVVLRKGSKEAASLWRRIQMVFQDPYASLDPSQRIGDALLEPLMVHRMARSRQEAVAKVRQLVDMVGLPMEVLGRLPRELSGGQRQRVAIARALTMNPELLVLDEPTSFLDVSVQARVLELLKELQRQLRLTYLFISHDLNVVGYMSDRIGVLYRGQLVEQGDSRKLLSAPEHPYTRRLVASMLAPNPEKYRVSAIGPRLSS